MKSILNKVELGKNSNRDDAIVIVSGLPRCGTSMMMQMLEAGGMPIMTDNIRGADEDNPRGYYEFERVKKIKEDTSWLGECHGRVFKMVSALLFYLPESKRYKVIFMKRRMEEMLASQNAMLERKGLKDDKVSDEEMAEKFQKHLAKVEDWMRKRSYIEVIHIDYNEVIRNPYENAAVVNRFLGGRLNTDRMAGIVETSLYRQRK